MALLTLRQPALGARRRPDDFTAPLHQNPLPRIDRSIASDIHQNGWNDSDWTALLASVSSPSPSSALSNSKSSLLLQQDRDRDRDDAPLKGNPPAPVDPFWA